MAFQRTYDSVFVDTLEALEPKNNSLLFPKVQEDIDSQASCSSTIVCSDEYGSKPGTRKSSLNSVASESRVLGKILAPRSLSDTLNNRARRRFKTRSLSESDTCRPEILERNDPTMFQVFVDSETSWSGSTLMTEHLAQITDRPRTLHPATSTSNISHKHTRQREYSDIMNSNMAGVVASANRMVRFMDSTHCHFTEGPRYLTPMERFNTESAGQTPWTPLTTHDKASFVTQMLWLDDQRALFRAINRMRLLPDEIRLSALGMIDIGTFIDSIRSTLGSYEFLDRVTKTRLSLQNSGQKRPTQFDRIPEVRFADKYTNRQDVGFVMSNSVGSLRAVVLRLGQTQLSFSQSSTVDATKEPRSVIKEPPETFVKGLTKLNDNVFVVYGPYLARVVAAIADTDAPIRRCTQGSGPSWSSATTGATLISSSSLHSGTASGTQPSSTSSGGPGKDADGKPPQEPPSTSSNNNDATFPCPFQVRSRDLCSYSGSGWTSMSKLVHKHLKRVHCNDIDYIDRCTNCHLYFLNEEEFQCHSQLPLRCCTRNNRRAEVQRQLWKELYQLLFPNRPSNLNPFQDALLEIPRLSYLTASPFLTTSEMHQDLTSDNQTQILEQTLHQTLAQIAAFHRGNSDQSLFGQSIRTLQALLVQLNGSASLETQSKNEFVLTNPLTGVLEPSSISAEHDFHVINGADSASNTFSPLSDLYFGELRGSDEYGEYAFEQNDGDLEM